MVNYSPTQLDRVFGALADRTRRAMVARLSQGDATVTELAAPFRMSLPAASKHLKVLERAGLLRRTIEGRVHRCRVIPGPLATASAWIDHHRAFWARRLDALEGLLEAERRGSSVERRASDARRQTFDG